MRHRSSVKASTNRPHVLKEGVSKDRARPFSRKHLKYWLPVTGGMILIGVIDVILGWGSYTKPSDVHERIIPDVPYARGSSMADAPSPATGCAPAIAARIESQWPSSMIVACTPDHMTVLRGERNEHKIELEVAGDEIRSVAETLTRPEIPATVMHAFAVAFPQTIPDSAVKRTRLGADPIYEIVFPPGKAHSIVTLRADGTVLDVR